MPIDYSIYGMNKGLDLGEAVEGGMKLREMADARMARQKAAQEQEQVKKAYDRAAIVDDQGNTTVDQQKLLSQLGGLNSQAARQAEQQIGLQQAQRMQQVQHEANFLAQTMGNVKSPADWERAKVDAQKAGLDISQYRDMPYDPDTVQRLYGMGVSARDRMMMENDAANRKAMREEQRYQHGVAREEREEAKTNQSVEKLQGKLSPLQDIQTSIGNVESKMGFKLDSYDADKNTATFKDGKKKSVDLPGVSLPGYGRITAHSTAARTLDDAMAAVFNVELKDRSGAAVTTPELARLQQEFSSGRFNTEPEKIRALQDYKRAATSAMKNVEAGYSPRAVATYGDRGGMTSQTVVGGQTGTQNASGYDQMSTEEIARLYEQRMKAARK